jgi:hypothetical protein
MNVISERVRRPAARLPIERFPELLHGARQIGAAAANHKARFVGSV